MAAEAVPATSRAARAILVVVMSVSPRSGSQCSLFLKPCCFRDSVRRRQCAPSDAREMAIALRERQSRDGARLHEISERDVIATSAQDLNLRATASATRNFSQTRIV